jgi:multiple sugar transport system permease protein
MEKVMTTWQMTASVLTVVPLLILFIIFRKYIMRGTSRAGIKG